MRDPDDHTVTAPDLTLAIGIPDAPPHQTHPVNISDIPFGITDWSLVDRTEHAGTRGAAFWRTQTFGGIRVRIVDYSADYLADHWCTKGHILLCLEGELVTELKDGRTFTLTPGMSYQVADNEEAHRSTTAVGCKLFIVD